MEEFCENGIDEDCSGTDESCTWFKDADGDGYSDGATQWAEDQPAGYSQSSVLQAESGDCDDGDGGVHPGAAEICFNRIDEDCSSVPDDDCITGASVQAVTKVHFNLARKTDGTVWAWGATITGNWETEAPNTDPRRCRSPASPV